MDIVILANSKYIVILCQKTYGLLVGDFYCSIAMKNISYTLGEFLLYCLII